MKAGLTELVFILDKSGSMGGLEKDTIGGYNAMLEKQKAVTGECRITTVLFDNGYELLHDRIDIQAVSLITTNEYSVGGSTALLDAIGRTIHKIGNAQKNTAEDYRAEKVMFVIITDGEENASHEFNYEKIKGMIENQQNKHGWEFIFLGANIDAIGVANQFGIAKDRAQNFINDSQGIELNYCAISDAITSVRKARKGVKKLAEGWDDRIKKDYQKRSTTKNPKSKN